MLGASYWALFALTILGLFALWGFALIINFLLAASWAFVTGNSRQDFSPKYIDKLATLWECPQSVHPGKWESRDEDGKLKDLYGPADLISLTFLLIGSIVGIIMFAVGIWFLTLLAIVWAVAMVMIKRRFERDKAKAEAKTEESNDVL